MAVGSTSDNAMPVAELRITELRIVWISLNRAL